MSVFPSMETSPSSTATEIGSNSLPDYTPSPAVPNYAEHPSPSEQRLLFIPRSHRVLHTSSWSKSVRGGVTVKLHAQEEGVEIPTYGRNGVVRGEVSFETDVRENFREVALKVSTLPGREYSVLRSLTRTRLKANRVSRSQKAVPTNNPCFVIQIPYGRNPNLQRRVPIRYLSVSRFPQL